MISNRNFSSFPGFHLPRPGEHEPGFVAFIPQNRGPTENQRTLRILVAGPHDAAGQDDVAAAKRFSPKLREDDGLAAAECFSRKLREPFAKKPLRSNGTHRQHASTGMAKSSFVGNWFKSADSFPIIHC